MRLHLFVSLLVFSLSANTPLFAQLTLVSKSIKVSIVYDSSAPKLDSISAHLLASDIQQVTGYQPQVFTDLSKAKGNVIAIGALGSTLIEKLLPEGAPLRKGLKG